MSFEKEIRGKVEELSRDLEGDLELQLDVQFELESHLWESYDANIERGMSEEESSEQAFKDFGALSEVKERLLAGNLKRLNKRAQVKAMLWYVFVPLSIFTALFFGGREYFELSRELPQSALDPKIVKLRQLENDFSDELYQELSQQMPNNAYLDSLWLGEYLEKSVNRETAEVSSEEEFAKLMQKMQEMVNKKDFDALRLEEMEVYQNFGRKSFLKSIKDVGHAAAFILPDLSSLRNLGKAVVKRENVDEVRLLEEVCRQRLENSDTLIGVLVIGAIGRIYTENKSLMENPELAKSSEFFSRCSQVIAEWKEKKKVSNKEFEKIFKERSSMLASTIIPALGTTEEMRNESLYKESREMEYNFFEKYYFSLLNSIGFMIMLGLIAFLAWHKLIKGQKQSLQLYSMREWLLHWAKFILVPLVAYQIYKFLPFASINWSIKETLVLYPIELLTLTFLLFTLSSWSLFCKYRKKLIIFDLADKKSLHKFKVSLLTVCLVLPISLVTVALCIQVLQKAFFSEIFEINFSFKPVIFGGWFYVIVILAFFALLIMLLKWLKASSIALCSLAQGQLINLAFLSLSLSIYSFIYLDHLESENAKNDRLIISKSSFTSVEEKVTKNLKKSMLNK